MAAVIRTATPADLIPLREELIALAAQAFCAAPWNEGPADAVRAIDRMWGYLDGPDFAAVIAVENEHLIGFAYGVTDSVCAALHPGPSAPAEAFEVVELAVVPAFQGRGIGRALHDSLLATAPDLRLLLTHPAAPARDGYRRWGWIDLGLVRMPAGRELILMQHAANHAANHSANHSSSPR